MACRCVLFCEDAAHEGFARAVLARVAREEHVEIDVRIGSASAGIPRLKQELRAFDRTLRSSSGIPDLLVILIDANAAGSAARKTDVDGALDLSQYPYSVVGIPDPEVECWYLADRISFAERFGVDAAATQSFNCKDRLVDAIERAGEILTGGGAEFADEIVEVMDLYRAGQQEPSLKHFLDHLRGAFRGMA